MLTSQCWGPESAVVTGALSPPPLPSPTEMVGERTSRPFAPGSVFQVSRLGIQEVRPGSTGRKLGARVGPRRSDSSLESLPRPQAHAGFFLSDVMDSSWRGEVRGCRSESQRVRLEEDTRPWPLALGSGLRALGSSPGWPHPRHPSWRSRQTHRPVSLQTLLHVCPPNSHGAAANWPLIMGTQRRPRGWGLRALIVHREHSHGCGWLGGRRAEPARGPSPPCPAVSAGRVNFPRPPGTKKHAFAAALGCFFLFPSGRSGHLRVTTASFPRSHFCCHQARRQLAPLQVAHKVGRFGSGGSTARF